MKYTLLASAIAGVILSSAVSFSQEFPQAEHDRMMSCSLPGNQDKITIEKDTPYSAILTYYNSAAKCSDTIDQWMQSDGEDPIRLRVRIIVRDSETIEVTPEDPQLVAIPPYASVNDGEEVTIQILPGLY